MLERNREKRPGAGDTEPSQLPYSTTGSMPDDDSRGLQSPDRPDASRATTDTDSTTESSDSTTGPDTTELVRNRLEAIDHLVGTVLADVQRADEFTSDDRSDDIRQHEARGYLRDVRVDIRRTGLLLFGPGGAIAGGSADSSAARSDHETPTDHDATTDRDAATDHDIPMIDRCGAGTRSHRGPDPDAFAAAERTRERDADSENTT